MQERQLADDAHVRAHTRGRFGLLVPRPMRGYRRSWLRGDLAAGVTVAALVIPLGLAIAELAGLPAVYGLYTSIVPVIVFGLVASSPQAVVGAEAALAGIVAAAIGPSVLDGHDPVHAAAALSLMVGVVCLVGAALRAGRLAQIVSRTVFVGYLAGVAVSISVGQLPKLLGSEPFQHSQLWRQVGELSAVVGSVHGASAAVGIVTLVAVLVGRLRAPALPIALVMLAATAVAVFLLDLEASGVAVIGKLPSGLPDIVFPALHWNDLLQMLPAALGLAVVAFADTTLVSQGFAARNGYSVNSSRDLAALGVADVASGSFGGLPVSASSARTAVAESNGARSQLAPTISAVTIALILIAAADLVSWIPQASLAGIIIAVMFGIVDTHAIRTLARGRRSELAVALVAFAGVAAVGVLEGVLVAVALSVAVSALRAASPHEAFLGEVPGHQRLAPMDEHPSARPIPGIIVYRFDAPLFFGNAEMLRDSVTAAVDNASEPVRHVVIAGAAITDIDYTASQVLIELATAMQSRGVDIVVAGLNHRLLAELEPTMESASAICFTCDSVEEVLEQLRRT